MVMCWQFPNSKNSVEKCRYGQTWRASERGLFAIFPTIYSRLAVNAGSTFTAYKTRDVRAMLSKFIINTYARALSRVERRSRATYIAHVHFIIPRPLRCNAASNGRCILRIGTLLRRYNYSYLNQYFVEGLKSNSCISAETADAVFDIYNYATQIKCTF